MNFKFRFSIGILFSLSLHLFLISTFVSWYPGILKNEDWKWGNWFPLSNKEIIPSRELSKSEKYLANKVSAGKIFFPDILLVENKEKTKIVKKDITPKISVKSILAHVEKFPKIISNTGDSKNELSQQVGEMLSLITPFPFNDSLSGKGGLNLKSGELRKYRHELNEFLSEKWEVPISLRGSNFIAIVQFKIKKNGRLISWEIEKSSNSVLKKTLENLLKNLQFLPSLPESYSRDSYKFGVKFTPSNLK